MNLPKYEIANTLTHLVGLVLFLIMGPLLIWKGASGPWSLSIGMGIFVFTLLFTYLFSTLYHVTVEKGRKNRMRIMDHIAIYLLIGGSYTAFISRFHLESTGYFILIAQWVIIVVGVILKLFYTGRYEIISIISYLLLGWMVVLVYGRLTTAMSPISEYFLIAGGASYTIGVLFYVWEKLPYHHAIWHIFVLTGSVCHFSSLWVSL